MQSHSDTIARSSTTRATVHLPWVDQRADVIGRTGMATFRYGLVLLLALVTSGEALHAAQREVP
jgi:hypothetical protein